MSAPEVTKYQQDFSLIFGVQVNVEATPGRIWNFLTDAENFSRWNSTVTSLEGDIREGGRLRVRIPGTTSVYAFTVSGFVPDERMIWTGGIAPVFKDVRSFQLLKWYDGTTAFRMTTRFSGLLLPFVRSSLAGFDRVFARYANDLKSAAEQPVGSTPSKDHAPVASELQELI